MQINNYLLLLFVYCLPFPPAKWDILKKGRARARAPHTQDKHLKIFFKNFEKIIAQIHSFSKFKMNIFCENSKGKIIKFQVLDEKIAPNIRHQSAQTGLLQNMVALLNVKSRHDATLVKLGCPPKYKKALISFCGKRPDYVNRVWGGVFPQALFA